MAFLRKRLCLEKKQLKLKQEPQKTTINENFAACKISWHGLIFDYNKGAVSDEKKIIIN